MMDDADIFEVSTVLRAALRSGIKRAAAVTACSAFTLADAEYRFGLERGRGLVIPNGVVLGTDDGDGAEASAAGTGAPFLPVPDDPDRRYILALGRVVDKKGFDLLLAAFAALADEQRTADLVIAGAGPALDGLRADGHRARSRPSGPFRGHACPGRTWHRPWPVPPYS